ARSEFYDIVKRQIIRTFASNGSECRLSSVRKRGSVDTHIPGWFAKQAGLFSERENEEGVDSAFGERVIVRAKTLCRGVGIDDESNQVPEEHLVNALALRGDEGRGTLR